MSEQVFLCSSTTGQLNGKKFVYLEAARWYDARKVAYYLLGTDEVDFKVLEERPNPTIHQGNGFTLKWVGSPLDPHNQPELRVIPWQSTEKSQEASSVLEQSLDSPSSFDPAKQIAKIASTTLNSGTSSSATGTKSSKPKRQKANKGSWPSAAVRKTKARGR